MGTKILETLDAFIEVTLGRKNLLFILNGIIVSAGALILLSYTRNLVNNKFSVSIPIVIAAAVAIVCLALLVIELIRYFLPNMIRILSGTIDPDELKTKYQGSYKHLSLTKHFFWWRKQNLRWIVYIVVISIIFLDFYINNNKPYAHVIAYPAAMKLGMLVGSVTGVLLVILYKAFQMEETEQDELPVSRKASVLQATKMISIFMIGQFIGQHFVMHTLTGVINNSFSTEIKTYDLKAKYWRTNLKWCSGLEVEYKTPVFPDGRLKNTRSIICLPDYYKDKFKKDTRILVSGPGTLLGVNIETIASPDNGIDSTPSPGWDQRLW